MIQSKVFYTKEMTPEAMVKMYAATGCVLQGNVAVKLHSGEAANQNFIQPDFLKRIIGHVRGTIVESNTAYEGKRSTAKDHFEIMRLHGWSDIAPVDILDEEGEWELEVPGGLQIQKNYVGSHLRAYSSMLVLSHFKGHPMGGFGGAIKNISIGIASSHGKAYIHGAGDPDKLWTADHDAFLESMADAGKSIMEYYQGNICFINIMKNLSVDCDCCAVAEDPMMADIGILSSMDPVALDQACVDLVYRSDDPGKKHLIERIESRNGAHTIFSAEKLGVGTRAYELVCLD